jgi:hypothetical protein
MEGRECISLSAISAPARAPAPRGVQCDFDAGFLPYLDLGYA